METDFVSYRKIVMQMNFAPSSHYYLIILSVSRA